jgi:hypothetical protein
MTFYPQSFTSNLICSPVLLVTCRCPHALSHTDGLNLYCRHCQSLQGPCCLLWYSSTHILSQPIILKIQICVLAHVVANNLKYHGWPSLNCLTLKKALWPSEGFESKHWTQHHIPQEPSVHMHSSGKLKSCTHYFISSVRILGTCRTRKACRHETINNALLSVVLQMLAEVLHKA